MNSKKALFVGCSFTSDSGFVPNKQPLYHWPHLICNITGHIIVNQAIGGMSNHEIFLRTIESISTDWYDLVVVMWSSIGRNWTYCSENNIDDFTILNKGIPKGLYSDKEFTKSYAKLHYTYFNNEFVDVKNWLLYCSALESVLKRQNTKFIFVKGFENYINDFSKVEYNQEFVGIDKIKKLLDFDHRPDDYILKKINEIKLLIRTQDTSKWLNFYSAAFKDMAIDLSDDGIHPGAKTNAELANSIINFLHKHQ